MKALKNILAIVLVLMVAVITFFTFNLVFSTVSNYQAISPTSLAFIPMFMFMCEIYVAFFAVFNYIVLKRHDIYYWRKYSLLMLIFSIFGFAFSIVCGTYVYHTFVGEYVFVAYPLFMLIVHTALLGSSCYVFVKSFIKIIKEKPEREWKNKNTYWVKELAIANLLIFGLEKLGAIVLLPLLWSSYDSSYVIPFYIQLLIPITLFVIYMIDQHWKHDKKLNIILYGSVLLYSVMSLTYMLIIAHNSYPLVVNSLSPIMQLERLITKPLGFIVLYLVSITMSYVLFTYNLIMFLKDKKLKTK